MVPKTGTGPLAAPSPGPVSVPWHQPAIVVVSKERSMGDAIATVLDPKPRDLGGFVVRRVLPSATRRTVGPFVFFDHMGPVDFAPGAGLDVRPHPHIGLATITYLFEGEILHRDSLGTVQAIVPGDVNWMTAGRGIVHSERTAAERRRAGHRLHGIQAWVGLPLESEEVAPSFAHHPATTLPELTERGVALRVIAGSAFGAASPVEVLGELAYVHARLEAGARFEVPGEHEERALHLVSGTLEVGGRTLVGGTMAVLAPGGTVEVSAAEASTAMLLSGPALDRRRHVVWNFVSSDLRRIDRARADWNASIAGGWSQTPFVLPPGEHEHIPLPEAATGPPPSTRDCPTT